MSTKLLLVVSLLVNACAGNNTPDPAPQGTSDATGGGPVKRGGSNIDDTGGSSDSADICADLKGNAVMAQDFSSLVARLCDGSTLKNLRGKFFSGAGDPQLVVTSKEAAGAKSDLTLASSSSVTSSAKSYFNMMKLQISKPSQFTSEGYESDPKVTYSVLTPGANKVQFSYKNSAEAPEVIVDYEAEASFAEVKKDSLYVVASKLTKFKETVQEFKGIIVISKKDGASSAEVFSLSDQKYDNNNNHATTVQKFTKNASAETKRSFNNSASASKADKYFQ
jgi:hypothetical protein